MNAWSILRNPGGYSQARKEAIRQARGKAQPETPTYLFENFIEPLP